MAVSGRDGMGCSRESTTVATVVLDDSKLKLPHSFGYTNRRLQGIPAMRLYHNEPRPLGRQP